MLPLQASLNKLFRCQQQNFSPPPKFIVKNELHEGQWSRMSLRWVQPPLRWLEEIINWGSSVSKRGQCFYACRPAKNIIQDCQAQNGVQQKNVFVEWWLLAEKRINYRFTGFVSMILAGLSVWKWVILGKSCITLAKEKYYLWQHMHHCWDISFLERHE